MSYLFAQHCKRITGIFARVVYSHCGQLGYGQDLKVAAEIECTRIGESTLLKLVGSGQRRCIRVFKADRAKITS